MGKICKKCGKENENNAKFCNNCGAELKEELAENKKDNTYEICLNERTLKKEEKPKKRKAKKKKTKTSNVIFLISIIFIVLFIIIISLYSYTAGNMATQEKLEEIEQSVKYGNYDEATELADKYFLFDKEGKEKAYKTIKFYKNYNREHGTQYDRDKAIEEQEKRQEEEIKSSKVLKIESLSHENEKNGYVNLNIKVKNNTDYTISYVKINIYYLDVNGNIIQSEWTNDSSKIKPGATQTITKYTKLPDGYDSYKVEIEQYH